MAELFRSVNPVPFGDPYIPYENLIVWLAELIASKHDDGRLEGIPELLEYAEARLPDREYATLEALVGF